MYQETSGVDNADYHIVYNYETIKLPPEAASSLKMTNVEPDSSALSVSDSLTSVTLSPGDALVPSCMNTPLPVTNVLTTTTLSENVRLTTPSLSVATPMTCTSITNGLPLTAVSLSPTNSPSAATAIPNMHFTESPTPTTLAVATMSEMASSSANTRGEPMEIGQIVHASEDGVLDGSLVSSSSIDAVVTSMVASTDCQGVVANGRKIPSQVIAKLLNGDSLSLDMVRIIADQDVENAPPHQPQSFNMLTARPSMLVHAKLTDNDIVNNGNLNQYHQVEVLNLRPTLRTDTEGSTPCSVVWPCAYCNMAFSSSEAIAQHQEKECTGKQDIAIATTTSPSSVESLMSPLRQVDETPFNVKITKESQNDKLTTLSGVHVKEEAKQLDKGYEIFWSCVVCGSEFSKPDDLNKHHLTHSVQELALVLLKFTKPQRRVKKVDKASSVSLPSMMPTAVATPGQAKDPSAGIWCKREPLDTSEEVGNNPEDTPPQTPPQEIPAAKVKKKSTSRAAASDKGSKKKSGKKTGKETKTSPKQRKLKGSVMGQGSRDPHTCHICNKVLSCRGNLAKHLVTHDSDKPFSCKPCGLGFNAKRDQQYHYLRYHTNERPNVCEVCGKGYVYRQYLLKHMVFHAKERQHSCEICGKMFLTAKCVMRHKKRHKKERPFKCPLCIKSFTVNADLKAHIRKIHRKKTAINLKQPMDVLPQQHKGTQQPLQHHKSQPTDNQHIKSKDITEFLLPGGTTLLPTDLESATLSGSVSSKEEVFITPDPLGSIIPLNANEYSTNVAPIGDHTTYVMINSADEDVTSQNVSAAHGLNIMYTAATAAAQQQVNELDRSHLSQGDITQGQHMLLSSSLDGTTRQLAEGTLHQHMESQTELSHQTQETQALTAITEATLNEGHQGGNLGVTAGPSEHGTELTSGGHDHSVVHSSHDPGNGFHLELLSQTIQLELQRTQTSTASYLGISDR